MIVGAVSDIGLKRENNQDYMFASLDNDFPIFIVADGMGGHKAGDIASSMAVEGILENLKKNKNKLTSSEKVKEHFTEAISEVNDKIYLKSLEISDYNGMGTTVTIAYVSKSKVYIGHVGDSRAYLISSNQITQITEDHSLVNELIKNGSITPAEAINHPQKNMITRAVGTSCSITMDFYEVNYKEDDVLILCSDGLSNMVDENTILRVVNINDGTEMNKSCNVLVSLAKENGGRDNITVIGIKFNNEVLK